MPVVERPAGSAVPISVALCFNGKLPLSASSKSKSMVALLIDPMFDASKLCVHAIDPFVIHPAAPQQLVPVRSVNDPVPSMELTPN